MVMTYEQEIEIEELKHKNKMEELMYIRESDRRKHENIKENSRIKSAEIRKSQERKYWNDERARK